jgi:hypothetical protein
MTSEEFWKDDPKLFSSYQKAYIEKAKRNNATMNFSNWLQGLYIYDGLKKSLADFGCAFIAGKKNQQKESYPSEPYDIFGDKEEKDLQKKKLEQRKNQDNLVFWATLKK